MPDALKGKTFMVTGACGQIGSAVVHELVKRGSQVVAVDLNPSSFAARYILDRDVVEGVLSYHDFSYDPGSLMWETLKLCDGVFHFGANTSTGISMSEAQENIRSSRHIYFAAVERHIPFVYASSAAVYGCVGDGKGPLSPYGFAKLSFDKLVEKDDNSLSQITALRFFNIYGGHETHKGNMRSMVRRLWDIKNDSANVSRSVKLFEGSRSIFRDFVHIDDAVRISLDVMYHHLVQDFFSIEKSACLGFSIMDVATGVSKTFYDVIHAFCRAYTKKYHDDCYFADFEQKQPDDVDAITYVTKAKTCTDGLLARAHIDLDEGIRRSLDFYEEHRWRK